MLAKLAARKKSKAAVSQIFQMPEWILNLLTKSINLEFSTKGNTQPKKKTLDIGGFFACESTASTSVLQ